MLEIECAGETVQLLPDKAVFWPAARSLIVADLHLGKPAAFRAAGIPVPELTTSADLLRLQRLTDATRAERLIILGDLFHSRPGRQAEMMAAVQAWRALYSQLHVVLVPGNHDRHAGAPPNDWNFQTESEAWRDGPFLFSHKPTVSNSSYVVAGHVHPAMLLRDKFGPNVRSPCFCFGPRRAILPAFGSFTGMYNIERIHGDRIYIVGKDQIIHV